MGESSLLYEHDKPLRTFAFEASSEVAEEKRQWSGVRTIDEGTDPVFGVARAIHRPDRARGISAFVSVSVGGGGSGQKSILSA